MSYELDALIGPLKELRTWRTEHGAAAVLPLTEDLGLVPLTGDLLLSIGSDPDAVALRASEGTTLARVQASYFGGVGSQSATVMRDGEVVARDVEVNEALRWLGVQASKGSDEWDTVGLGRFRKTARWAARALVPDDPREDRLADLIGMLSFSASDGERQEMTRSEAAAALGRLGPPAAAAVDRLARLLRAHRDWRIRIAAAQSLGRIGPAAAPAVSCSMSTRELTSETPRKASRGGIRKSIPCAGTATGRPPRSTIAA